MMAYCLKQLKIREESVWRAVLVVVSGVVLAGCSSGGGAHTPTPALAATGATPVPAGSAVGETPSANMTPSALEATIRAAVEQPYKNLDDNNIDAALQGYSKCVRKTVTADNLEFGRNSTGKLTLAEFTLLSSTDTTASARMVTQTQFLIGRQNMYTMVANFVFEDGAWRLNSGGQGC
jgi:hypothetical protein